MKKPKERSSELFDDPLVNQALAKLAWLGAEPVCEGPTGEERELQHKYILDVLRAVATALSQMPAVTQALRYVYPDEAEEVRFGKYGSGLAILFRLHPDDFMRHVLGRKEGLDLEVRKLPRGVEL